MKRIHEIIFIVAAFVILSCDKKDEAPPAINPDSIFAINAANANLAEVELGVLAREHGDNQAIREFGAKMATEHTTALSDLQAIMDEKNIPAPAGLDSAHLRLKQRLMMLSGMAFDTAYINSQITDHEKVIAEFDTEARNGSDADLMAYATNNLPHLNEHLTSAQAAKTVVMAQLNAGRKPD